MGKAVAHERATGLLMGRPSDSPRVFLNSTVRSTAGLLRASFRLARTSFIDFVSVRDFCVSRSLEFSVGEASTRTSFSTGELPREKKKVAHTAATARRPVTTMPIQRLGFVPSCITEETAKGRKRKLTARSVES